MSPHDDVSSRPPKRPDEAQVARILVVEDEYFIADDIARELQKLGMKVVGPVSDAADAIVLLDREDIDGAVLDINLKGNMAYGVADALRKRGIPFGFATGYGEEALPFAYRDVPRWEKPFDLSRLASAVATLVAIDGAA